MGEKVTPMAQQKPITEKSDATIRRIVVGLETGFMAREALALAARMAVSVDAGLYGIFVEDENLLALTALPFARRMLRGRSRSPGRSQRGARTCRVWRRARRCGS